MCQLSQLKIGQQGVLTKIADTLEIKKRLLDIGFTKGSIVKCLMRGSFQGPIAYEVKNTVIALREKDSDNIYVEVEA